MTEVEVLTNDNQFRTQRVDQHLVDEVLGRLVGPGPVEGDHQGALDPATSQELELLVEVGEQGGGRLGPHHTGRMAIEGDDHRREVQHLGPGHQIAEEGPVTEVNAVIGANGDSGP